MTRSVQACLLPRRLSPRRLIGLLLLASAWVPRPGQAGPAVPAADGSAKPTLSMEDLRQRLAERVAQAQAGATRGGVPALTVNVKAPPGGARRAGPGAVPASAPAQDHAAVHWDYEGPQGPQAWGHLDAGFATCATGRRQSPIDLRDGFRVELEPIDFQYRPGSFSVIDNGHTVQIDVAPGNGIVVGGRRFELVQFHFHRPSEERIDGRQFEMVVHLVHRDADGRLAVVAVLVDRGSRHPAMQQVLNNLPLEKRLSTPGAGMFDPAALLPEDRRYFTYMGSLTTPPCTEGVLWLVLKTPVGLAPDQIGLFARLYPMNARPLQPPHDRMVKESR